MWKFEGHCFPLRICYRLTDIRWCFLTILFSPANTISLGKSTGVSLSFNHHFLLETSERLSSIFLSVSRTSIWNSDDSSPLKNGDSAGHTSEICPGSRCGSGWNQPLTFGLYTLTRASCLGKKNVPLLMVMDLWWSWPCVTICYGEDTVSIALNSDM